MKPLLIVAASVALAAPAAAQVRVIDDARTESAPEMKAAADGRRICKTHKVTGSRLSKQKECRTAEEWAKVHAKGKGVVDDLVRKSTSNNCIMYGSKQRGGCAGG